METKKHTPLLLLHLTTILVHCIISPNLAFAAKKSYIVYLGGHSHGEEASLEDFRRATDFHQEFLGTFLGSKDKAREAMFYSYAKYINGFAAILEEEEAKQISKHPRVISVFRNKLLQLHTTRSWAMLMLERNHRVPPMSLWSKARFGEDVIVGNLDTGVWPESESFNDQGMGPVPSRWKGSCQNNTKEGVRCNRKLIGAKYFHRGFLAERSHYKAKAPAESSARDMEGHGTHTLSTAGGRFVPRANLFGYANGTAKGGSPNARVAAYKVCWEQEGCASADVLLGFEEAIHDGVDVISVSLGGHSYDYMTNPVAVGAFHAVQKGISVVCSAGNSGPIAGSIINDAPWIFTVGASTMDRDIISILTLGNKKQIKGESASSSESLPANRLYPLIFGEDAKSPNASASDGAACRLDSLDPKKAKGKIVICLRDETSDRIDMGHNVLTAGGVGMVLVNDEMLGDNLRVDPHILPATHISFNGGAALRSYFKSTKLPVGHISAPRTQYGVKPAPLMTDFTSRGPSLITPQILKPDITAPGASVLAAYTQATSPTGFIYDTRRVQFALLYGTSMACPHVSGIVGLLRALHPDWSPAALRSAIMTTARVRDNTGNAIRDYTLTKADPLAYGAGHVRPNRAMDPGLVYDLNIDDYLNFLCTLGYNSSIIAMFNKKPYSCPSKKVKLEDLNYPSIACPNLIDSLTIKRRLKNVGSPGIYNIRIQEPRGVFVTVTPKALKFDKVGEEKTFEIVLKARRPNPGIGYTFGKLIWSDGKHYVRSPIAVNVMS